MNARWCCFDFRSTKIILNFLYFAVCYFVVFHYFRYHILHISVYTVAPAKEVFKISVFYCIATLGPSLCWSLEHRYYTLNIH